MRSRRRNHDSGGANDQHSPALPVAALGTAALCFVLVVSAIGDRSALGVPTYWPWLLTALQVLALWSAGRGSAWGWLLGGSVQVPWIVYAMLTSQIGFIPGCAISAAVQVHSFQRARSRSAGRGPRVLVDRGAPLPGEVMT